MELQKIHRTYSQKLIQSGKGSGTCDCYEVVARQFLKYLQEELHIGTEELQLSDISGFIPYLAKLYQVTSMRTALSALRSFLTFLYQEGYSMVNLLPAVPSSCARKSAIVPTITVEEESCLLQAIDRSKNQGKRDYAMLLLAIRTGLRSIDIINLKLSDIDWYEKVLSIIQQKTGKPLTLPLMPDVGNALADYILNARPESSLPYVFLRSTLPYGKLSGCYSISRSIMDKANVRQSEKQSRGFHVYRHSVAARMLANEVPLSVISNALGHVSMASSKTYLSTDKEHLKACSLSLEGIEVAKEELR
jgi:site-specific recombinase XerD